MPCATREEQNAYQLKWMRARREAYFEHRSCALCGSVEELELDHIDPALKVDHKVWSWSAIRRNAELAKCRVLCRPCHKERTSVRYALARRHGTATMYERGCKCGPCRRSNADRRAAWRLRTGRH